MGLFDWFKRPQTPSPDDWLRLGRLEAKVESLTVQWVNYRDEIQRAANRLEQRDRRAAKAQEAVSEGSDQAGDDQLPLEVLGARLRRDRQRRN